MRNLGHGTFLYSMFDCDMKWVLWLQKHAIEFIPASVVLVELICKRNNMYLSV